MSGRKPLGPRVLTHVSLEPASTSLAGSNGAYLQLKTGLGGMSHDAGTIALASCMSSKAGWAEEPRGCEPMDTVTSVFLYPVSGSNIGRLGLCPIHTLSTSWVYFQKWCHFGDEAQRSISFSARHRLRFLSSKAQGEKGGLVQQYRSLSTTELPKSTMSDTDAQPDSSAAYPVIDELPDRPDPLPPLPPSLPWMLTPLSRLNEQHHITTATLGFLLHPHIPPPPTDTSTP